MATPPSRLVMFADILGFGSLTETVASDKDMSFDVGELLRPETVAHLTPVAVATPKSWFLAFHSAVARIALREKHRLGNHSVVAFSDSVFIVGEKPGIVRGATALMKQCILTHIPIRIGVGYGTWTEIHFSSSLSANRHSYSAQFFGSGVTYAFNAEHRGGKGLRIFVHPSAAAELSDSRRLLPLPSNETSVHASHELDYCRRRVGRPADVGTHRKMVHALSCMEQPIPAVMAHYLATRKALGRMNPTRQNSRGVG